MQPARELPIGLRISVALIGVVLLLVAGVGVALLREGPWNWWIAGFSLLLLLEGLDFLLAAFRRGTGWPTPAYFLVDLIVPW